MPSFVSYKWFFEFQRGGMLPFLLSEDRRADLAMMNRSFEATLKSASLVGIKEDGSSSLVHVAEVSGCEVTDIHSGSVKEPGFSFVTPLGRELHCVYVNGGHEVLDRRRPRR